MNSPQALTQQPEKLASRLARAALLSGLAFLLVASPLLARPPFKQSLRRYYGDNLPQSMHACTTCHLTREQVDDPKSFDESAPPHNAFGTRLSNVINELPEAEQSTAIGMGLSKIAQEDADGDGVANEIEILAGHAPGIATDKPTAEEVAAASGKQAIFTQYRARSRWEPFKPVVRPMVPQLANRAEVANPIDAFIGIEHEARGLQPRPEASRAVLLRRVTLDLIGLPPTPAELQAFLEDSSPNAYERVVDRLLASPQFGERWGRHWMDVWRYSDWAGWTDGKQIRDSQPHIWRWRDWIIESLNADKPYDCMVSEMLAADEISPGDSDTIRATGFLARNYKMLSRETWMQDTVNHTALAFLGLTMGCARCHDHMYDPILQKEYYGLRAIFDPHQVRLDRLANEPDTTKDGIPRVFDSNLTEVTYLLRRGDDRDPDKEHPLAPGVPKLLGDVPFQVAPVSLPADVYYPALKPYVQKELVAAAETDLAQSEAALKQATEALTAAEKAASQKSGQKSAAGELDAAAVEMARTKAGLAQKLVAASQARLASVHARVAADIAKYANPPAANANDLALAAGKAEREAAFAESVVETVKAEMKRVAAIAAPNSADEKGKMNLAEAEKQLAEAVQKRAAADKSRGEATASYSPLGPVYPQQSSGRRAALARWITDRQNPLAARVAVNQIWLRHFGQPLVPTVFDFGQNGQEPTHPALVDWLAAELMEPSLTGGQPAPAWSMKHLHRLIVTSRTYRRASTPDDKNLALDADNRWLWRMPSRRMEAELVRDGILYVAGQLDLAMGGADIDHKQGLAVRRRSVYFQHAQEKQMEFLKTFDCAAVTECYQRKESIVPQQALALANSELTFVQARIIARQLHNESAADDNRFVTSAFEQVLSRTATTEELQLSLAFLADQRKKLASIPDRVAASGGPIADPRKPSGDVPLRSRESLVHVLLNHNDFVTIR